jgi:hypothetical protein
MNNYSTLEQTLNDNLHKIIFEILDDHEYSSNRFKKEQND